MKTKTDKKGNIVLVRKGFPLIDEQDKKDGDEGEEE